MLRITDSEREAMDLFGVSLNATKEELQHAYRRLAMLHHPDRNPSDLDSGRRFNEVTRAFEIAKRYIERRNLEYLSTDTNSAFQNAPEHDHLAERDTSERPTPAPSLLRNSVRFIIGAVILIQLAFILLVVIWLNTKTDWLPG